MSFCTWWRIFQMYFIIISILIRFFYFYFRIIVITFGIIVIRIGIICNILLGSRGRIGFLGRRRRGIRQNFVIAYGWSISGEPMTFRRVRILIIVLSSISIQRLYNILNTARVWRMFYTRYLNTRMLRWWPYNRGFECGSSWRININCVLG